MVFLAGLSYQVTAVDASRVGLDKSARLAEQNRVEVELLYAGLADFDPGQQK